MRHLLGFREPQSVGSLKILSSIVFVSATVFAAFAATNAQETIGQPVNKQAWTLPASVADLLYARRFTLAEGYKWSWPADAPPVRAGVIVVLRVDSQLVVPRNTLSPILYAGDRMVQTLNHGHISGKVIGIVPGDVDLLKTPIWFGSPRVPAQVNEQSVRKERDLAEKAGIRPFDAKRVEGATKAPLEAPDFQTLLRGELADLVLEHAPQESHLARKWRLPEAKSKPERRNPIP